MNNNYERTQSIVEELRADIDFELDDVIAKIVQGLPEDYFTSLSATDQLKPLKALLAMGICQINDEIMMRSDDGHQVAVVANQNYAGQLSEILRRLPKNLPLMGAKIFTSNDHDFIIDVFDFRPPATNEEQAISDLERGHLIEEVARLTQRTNEVIAEFVSHYPTTSPILSSPSQVAEQFLAIDDIEHSGDTAIRWNALPDSNQTRVTISVGRTTARKLFQTTAEYLGLKQMDIDRAWLHDIPLDQQLNTHVAVASFLLAGNVDPDVEALRKFLDRQLDPR